MPLVTAIPKGLQNGNVLTEFTDTTNLSSVTYTYPVQQTSLVIENSGEKDIFVTVGSYTDQLIQADKKWKVDTLFTSFSIRSNTNSQEFIATAIYKSVEDFASLTAQLSEKAKKTDVDTQIAAVASGSPKGVYTTVSALQTAFPTGNTNIYLVTGNVKEVDSLTVTAAPTTSGNVTVTLNGVAVNVTVTSGVKEVASLTVTAIPTVAGNVTVTLNGVATDIALDPATDTTTDLVATKIRNAVYSTGAVTGGTASTVTFTAAAVGVKTDATYSAGSTGTTGTMSTTTQGVDADTTTSVATKIRGTVFSGWTTGGSGTTVTFTATVAGTKTAPSYSAGTTGVTGTITITTAGVNADGNWYYWNGSAWIAGGVYQATGLVAGSITPKITNFMTSGKNMFNEIDTVVGNYISAVGVLTANASFNTTDFIPLTVSLSYTISNSNSKFYYLSFYDANKTFISQVTTDGTVSSTTGYTFTANQPYIRISYFQIATNNMLEQGATKTTYEAFIYVLSESINFNLSTSDFKDKTITKEKTTFINTKKNLLNRATSVEGVLNPNTGAIDTSTLFDTTVMIPLTIANSYTLSCGGAGSYLAFYKADNTYAGLGQYVTTGDILNGTNYTFVANYPFVKISYRKTALDVMFENGNTKTVYEPFTYIIDNGITTYQGIDLDNRVKEIENTAVLYDYSIFDLAYIKKGKLVANKTVGSNTTAKYTAVDLGAGIVPVSMKFKVIFSEGTNSTSAMAISNPNGASTVANITTKSCHFGMNQTKAFVEWFTDGVNDNKYSYTFTTPCLLDGVTEYTFGWSVSGNTVTFAMPDGTTQIYTDAQMATHLGRYCTFEHFYSQTDLQTNVSIPQFTYFEVVGNNGIALKDSFKRFDGAIGVAPTGQTYVQITNW